MIWFCIVYLGFYVAFNTVQVISRRGSWKGRGNQYIQFVSYFMRLNIQNKVRMSYVYNCSIKN